MWGAVKHNEMPGGRVRLRWPLYFVRHGQTDWNVERRFQGHAEIPINETGRKQAARNGNALAAEIEDPERLFFASSPLIRTRQTMEIIRERLSLPPQRYMIDDRLIEIDLGEWNGRTPDEVNADDPGIFERRNESKWDFTIPGGESYADAAIRTRDFLMSLTGPTLAIGHGASGRLLRGYLRGLKPEQVAHLPAPQDVVFKLNKGEEIVL